MPRLLERLLHRLHGLILRRRADASLTNEIALHLEEAEREHRARGLSPAEARLAARRDFGAIALIEDQCRDTRRVAVVQSLLQDLRHGLRGLVAQPLLTIAAVASIGAGAGATAFVFGLASELLLARPTGRDVDALVNITLDGNSHVSYTDWRALDESGVLAGLAGYHIEGSINVRQGEGTVAIVPLLATANFFDVLGVPMALGRGFTAVEAAAEREPRMVVISDRFWRLRLGGDRQAVGRTVVINGEPYTVLGVLPAGLKAIPGFGLSPEIYLPLSRSVLPGLDHPHAAAAQLVGRLKPGQSVEQATAALDTVVRRRHLADPSRPKRVGQMVLVTDGLPGFGARSIWQFFALLGVVGALVLGIACANVAGLLLARNTVRQKELALRAALGASRGRIVQQLLVEALWLTTLGTTCGIVLMLVAMAAIGRVPLPLPLPFELGVSLDWRLFGLTLTMVALATLGSGVLPALQGARPSLAPALKQVERTYVHRRWTARGLLVVGQVTISVGLVVTALLFVRNLSMAQSSSPGFHTTRTLVAQIGLVEHRYTPARRIAYLQDVVDRVDALPGVERAAFAFGMPLTVRHGRTSGAPIGIAGEPTSANVEAHWAENMVSPGYFDTLGIARRQGRDFAPTDTAGTPRVVVVNEAFVERYLGGRPPIGLHVLLPGPGHDDEYEIVGVVANSRYRTIGEAQMAAIYYAYRQRPTDGRVLHVVARVAGDPALAARPISAAIAALDPSAAVDVQTVNQSLAFAFLPSRVGAALLGSLGAIGLTLAMAGLFAMVSYSVTRRTREIGVRVALGAPRGAVVRLVVGDAIVLVGIGLVGGLGAAAVLTPALASFLVTGLSPTDPTAFVGTAVFVVAISLLATVPPIRRATGVGPLVALRTE
jgi:predicted permease